MTKTLKEITEEFESTLKTKLLPEIQRMVDEQKKLLVPIARKQVGMATVSLLEDARILIQYPSKENAEKHYKSMINDND